MFGCMRRLVGLVLLLLIVVVGWFFRDTIREKFNEWTGKSETEMTEEELAASAAAKLDRLAAGKETETVGLSEAELQALVRQRVGPVLPGFVHDPGVELDDGRVALEFRVAATDIPRLDELGEAAALLPDTVDVVTRGTLRSGGPQLRFLVEDVTVARIPLPDRMIPGLLGRLRQGGGAPRTQENAIFVPLPAGVSAAYVQGDSLFLMPGRTGTRPAR